MLRISWLENRDSIMDYPGGPNATTGALKSWRGKQKGQSERCSCRVSEKVAKHDRALTHGSRKMVFEKSEKRCRWSLGAKTSIHLTANKETGPPSYSWKELNSANDVNDLRNRWSSRAPLGRQAIPQWFLLSETLSRVSSWAHQAPDLRNCEFINGCCWKFPHLCWFVSCKRKLTQWPTIRTVSPYSLT